jgi:general secretion pathway protein C
MKHAFVFIHLLVLTLIAYLGVGIMYKNLNFSPGHGKAGPAGTADRSAIHPRKAPLTPEKRQQTITRRNLFNVLTQDKNPDTDKPPLEQTLEKTDLKLALWGTVTGEPMGSSYAVIEDKKTKIQSLFQVGDAVQRASIKQIMRNKIILTLDGKDQILEVEPSQRPAGRIFQNNMMALPNQKSINGNPLGIGQQPFGDTASFLKQVKIRPYFKNGKPNGLLLYGIKPGSPFQNLGLRNGDIVQKLNGEETMTAQDVQTIYQNMEATPEIEFIVRRQGQTKEILYNGQTNSYTVEDASNE